MCETGGLEMKLLMEEMGMSRKTMCALWESLEARTSYQLCAGLYLLNQALEGLTAP